MNESAPMFLTDPEIEALTAFKRKSLQVAQLRKMGIKFWINAAGKPVIARSAIDGSKAQPAAEKPAWKPAVLQRAA